MDTIKVQIGNETKVVPKGTTVQEVLGAWPGQTRPQIMAAKVGKDLRELSFRLTEDTTVTPIDLATVDGVRIYSRSLTMVMIRAAREVYPQCRVKIMYSLSKGLYGELDIGRHVMEKDLRQIEQRMKAIIQADELIEKRKFPWKKQFGSFRKKG